MSTEPKMTVDLPFSPADVLRARPGPTEREKAAYDRAWEIVRHNPDLAQVRHKCSIHEIRLIIAAVGAAFAMEPVRE